MSTFLSARKSKATVFPTGVPVEYKALIGLYQAWLTDANETKRKEAIDKMLLDCLVSIGSKTNLIMADVEALLDFDKAFLLFDLRQFSNKNSSNFVFDYEFAADSQGHKRKQRYDIFYAKKDFPQRPARWVFEKMKADYIAAYVDKNEMKAEDWQETSWTPDMEKTMLQDCDQFPKMYDTYAEMLSANLYETIRLDDSGVDVTWRMVDGARAKKFGKDYDMKNANSHTQLLLRDPKYKKPGAPESEIGAILPLNDLTNDDIEQLRTSYIQKEAFIDTSVTIMFAADKSTEKPINLIHIAAFFFPSLAVQ
jgi:hypothetical protein